MRNDTLVDLAENPLPVGYVISFIQIGRVVLRVARWLPHLSEAGRSRGTVAILPGRSEFIEKYAEVIENLLARDLAVVVVDWRGQGGSSRLLKDPCRGHVWHFDDYRADLDAVVREVLLPFCSRPYFALAHSMGGAIVIDHAARGDAVFDRMVLSAPMFDLYGLRLPTLARWTAAIACAIGAGQRYVPGGSGQSWMTKPFEGNDLTSDRGRFAAFNALARAAPHLILGAPTLGWLRAAFDTMDRLRRAKSLHRITTPILAVGCGADTIVDNTATARLVGHLKNADMLVIPHALHEILMERDTFRAQFWAAFDHFIPGSSA